MTAFDLRLVFSIKIKNLIISFTDEGVLGQDQCNNQT